MTTDIHEKTVSNWNLKTMLNAGAYASTLELQYDFS